MLTRTVQKYSPSFNELTWKISRSHELTIAPCRSKPDTTYSIIAATKRLLRRYEFRMTNETKKMVPPPEEPQSLMELPGGNRVQYGACLFMSFIVYLQFSPADRHDSEPFVTVTLKARMTS